MPSDSPSPDSDLVTRLQNDMKAAMKSADKERLGVIRMLLSDARAADMQTPPTTPEKMVQAYHKRLTKSREEYEKLGNAEELAKLDRELAVVADYVPKQADAGETAAMVDAFLAEHPEFGQRDVGKATGLFMKSAGGNVDAKAANARIREVLATRS